MLEAELEFNVVPHTEKIWWCFILKKILWKSLVVCDTPNMLLLKDTLENSELLKLYFISVTDNKLL